MNEQEIVLTKKQASVSIGLLIILQVLIFIAGYFWGKQSAAQQHSEKRIQDSFNDRVHYLLTL